MKKTQQRWGDAHVKLKELFDARAGMSQQDFAERHGLGSQGMVWQYLAGYRPLNYEAAAKFARGLGCRIDDFSPEMAESLREEILPVLGRAAKLATKAAMVLALAVPPLLVSSEAKACFFKAPSQVHIMVNSVCRWLRRFLRGALHHSAFVTRRTPGLSAA
jgi:transcriptional regulator with XRE-family HTH domain